MHLTGKTQRPEVASLLLLLLFKAQLTALEALKLSSVHIPSLVQRGSNFWLICQFHLQSNEQEQLYSVKWYRNNEEFYRLMLASPAEAAPLPPEVAPNQQQQYFAQSGINVMMSSSNATHVRLLNASLESEGIYACEISTQNLSTIRYEKNIRVYVLPNSKLNIIGFKNRYSLNDKVDLACQSDFSRPQPALAWFINGRRIRNSNQWFELEATNKSKLNEASSFSLFAASLRLKFKLSAEFLAEYLSAANQRNQSQKKSSSSSSVQAANLSPYQLQTQLLETGQLELKLYCSYKLAEVSEVTYNELTIAGPRGRKSPAAASSNRKQPGASGSRLPEVRLSKSSQSHQVLQSRSPASANSLSNFLQNNYYANIEQQCNLGALALLPDDPLLVVADSESREEEEGGEEDESLEELSIGESLSVDCSTVSALLPTRLAQQKSWRLFRAGQCNQNHPSNGLDGPHSRRRLLQQPISSPQQYLNKNSLSPDNHNYNNGPANEEEVAPNQRLPQPLPGGNQRQRQLLTGVKLHPVPAAAAYLWLERPITLNNKQPSATTDNNKPATTTADSSTSSDQPQLAPPLLEWFINNQEAPASSVSGYSPDLPLLEPAGNFKPSNQSAGRNGSRPHQRRRLGEQTLPDLGPAVVVDEEDQDQEDGVSSLLPANSRAGARQTGSNSDGLPSVDSTEYFANFDARPIEQKLALSFRLDKKHFMTPDSTLKLKCTSTQAQVLLADSASFTIMPVVIKPGQTQPEVPLPNRWQQQRQIGAKPKARTSNKQKAANGFGRVLANFLICIPLTALSVHFVISRNLYIELFQ